MSWGSCSTPQLDGCDVDHNNFVGQKRQRHCVVVVVWLQLPLGVTDKYVCGVGRVVDVVPGIIEVANVSFNNCHWATYHEAYTENRHDECFLVWTRTEGANMGSTGCKASMCVVQSHVDKMSLHSQQDASQQTG